MRDKTRVDGCQAEPAMTDWVRGSPTENPFYLSGESGRVFASHFQEMHSIGVAKVTKFCKENLPIVKASSIHDLGASMPSVLNHIERISTEIIGEGARRKDWEFVIYWLNLPTLGVVSAMQLNWVSAMLEAQLLNNNSSKTRAVCVILANNRAGDLTDSGVKEEDETDDEDDESGDEGGSKKEKADTESKVREVYNKIITDIESKELQTSGFRILFKRSTVYGKRKAYHDGLLVTAANCVNVFHDGDLWKHGGAEDVDMLPRAQCRRPAISMQGARCSGKAATVSKKLSGIKMSQKMTLVQAKKQACPYMMSLSFVKIAWRLSCFYVSFRFGLKSV